MLTVEAWAAMTSVDFLAELYRQSWKDRTVARQLYDAEFFQVCGIRS